MSIFSNIKVRARAARLKTKAIAAGFTLGIASIAAIATMAGAAAAPVSTPNCDNNAVITGGVGSASAAANAYNKGSSCKAGGKTYSSSASSIQHIYNYNKFGISSSDMSSLGSNAKAGYVTKGGDVYVGTDASHTLVATGALTAGRQNFSGSTVASNGGTTFYIRTPSVSFANNELAAIVDMKGGVFQFAILNSCGNPVAATPKKTSTPPPPPAPSPKPGVSILKEVRAGTSGSYSRAVTVKSGSTVEYQITVTSTGNAPLTNAVVRDALPTDVKYTTGLQGTTGGQTVMATPTDVKEFFGSGKTYSSIPSGAKFVYNFEATAGNASDTSSSCKPENLINSAFVSATGLGTQESQAEVITTCSTTPPPPPQCTPGSANNNSSCYQCTVFTVSQPNQNNPRQVNVTDFQATTTDSNAKLTNVKVDWSDGSASTVAATDAKTLSHIYQDSVQSATITATPEFTVNGQTALVPGTACTQSVSFPIPATTTSVVTPTTPASLPNTGAGDVIGIFLGTVVAGTVAFRMFIGRKLARR